MTAIAPAAQLVRITVHGPAGRADLAVPASTTVADLLPVLLQHTSGDTAATEEHLTGAGWVLQRLGGPPLDPDGTPETLDWLEGEQFHLRPADDTMPELDFDDIADGMATAVGRQRDRWRPEFSRWLFLGVALCAVLAAVWALTVPGSDAAGPWPAIALAVVFTAATLVAGGLLVDGPLTTVLGLSAGAFAWVAGTVGADPAAASLTGRLLPAVPGALAGASAVAAVAGLILGGRAVLAAHVPVLPFATLALTASTLALGAYLNVSAGHAGFVIGAVLSTVFVAAVIAAPRVVLRFARLHGPQLPRTADDLQVDIEPLPADQVVERTALADRCLSVLMLSTAAVLGVSYPLLLDAPGWAPAALAGLLAAAVGLRARIHLTVAQRAALSAAGVFGAVLLARELAGAVGGAGRAAVLTGLLAVCAMAVTAALRPASRRPRPVWAHLANLAETLTMISIVPVLLQVLGAYAWARGLAG